MRDVGKVLRSPFEVEAHKETFVDYLEVMVDVLGGVHYAVPSHQRFMEHAIIRHWGLESIEDVWAQCGDLFDYFDWLLEQTGCVAVWNDRVCGKLNEAQHRTLMMLEREGLYRGDVPAVTVFANRQEADKCK